MTEIDQARFEAWQARFGRIDALLDEAGIDAAGFMGSLDLVKHGCRQAWLAGVMTGFNGNLSLRLGKRLLLVTASGIAKGHMEDGDVALATKEGSPLAGPALSSETAMHAAVYEARPEARCVLHTHPGCLLALSVKLAGCLDRMLDMPLFEAAMWRPKLAIAGAYPPGSHRLADSVGKAAAKAPAVFMEGHGLCTAGAGIAEALGITEQMEHLAEIQLRLL